MMKTGAIPDIVTYSRMVDHSNHNVLGVSNQDKSEVKDPVDKLEI